MSNAGPSDANDSIPPETVPPPAIPSPDLGAISDASSLIAALVSAGPFDNETAPAVAEGRAPSLSICDAVMNGADASMGVLVHQAIATGDGSYGVVFVILRSDGSREVRMYGTGEADPATGGCPLWLQADM